MGTTALRVVLASAHSVCQAGCFPSSSIGLLRSCFEEGCSLSSMSILVCTDVDMLATLAACLEVRTDLSLVVSRNQTMQARPWRNGVGLTASQPRTPPADCALL